MPKDYYLVLGIPADSTQGEIKAAYRRLAKEFHPDCCSDRHTPFLGIQEAYSVLGDPMRRKEYDETRRATYRKTAPRRNFSTSSPEIVEPLIPERQSAFGHAPSFRPHRPNLDSLFDQLFGGASGHDPWQENPAVEVVLTKHEAHFGGVIRLHVPGLFPCQACGGSGDRDLFFACAQCRGTGVNHYEYPLRLEFPPGVPDNSILRLPLDSFGRRDSWLTVRFRIRS